MRRSCQNAQKRLAEKCRRAAEQFSGRLIPEDGESLAARSLQIQPDLLDPASLDAAAQEILARWDRLEVLVNNAMSEMGRYKNAWIKDTSMEKFAAKIQANFLAPLSLVKHFPPCIIEAAAGASSSSRPAPTT